MCIGSRGARQTNIKGDCLSTSVQCTTATKPSYPAMTAESRFRQHCDLIPLNFKKKEEEREYLDSFIRHFGHRDTIGCIITFAFFVGLWIVSYHSIFYRWRIVIIATPVNKSCEIYMVPPEQSSVTSLCELTYVCYINFHPDIYGNCLLHPFHSFWSRYWLTRYVVSLLYMKCFLNTSCPKVLSPFISFLPVYAFPLSCCT